jgi:hypothetical protein
MPQALLRVAPYQPGNACLCLEPSRNQDVLIDLDRAERRGISGEAFWACGLFLMRMAKAEERQVARALVSIGAPNSGEQFSAQTCEAESPAKAFAIKAGLAMFTAGGRKLGTIAGMP